MNEKEYTMTLWFSDRWAKFSNKWVARLLSTIWSETRNLKDPIPMVTCREKDGRVEGFSGIILTTKSYLVVHTYESTRNIRVDFWYDKTEGILEEEDIVPLILEHLSKRAKHIDEPPDEIA